MSGGWFSYSPLLLRLSALGIGAGHAAMFGLVLVTGFLLSLSALPPCRSWREVLARSLAVVSAAAVFAVERANLDVAIFLITLAGVSCAVREDRWRFAGYALFVLAALVKFYPAVLLLLALREKPGTVLALAVSAVAAAAAVLLPLGGETGGSGGRLPGGSPFTDMFGAVNVPLGLVVPLTAPPGMFWEDLVHQPMPMASRAILAGLLLAAALIVRRNLKVDRATWPTLSPLNGALLVAGAVLMVGCFLAAQNIAYRAIFLLLTLPGLFALMRGAPARRRSYAWLIAGVLFFVWEEFFHYWANQLQAALSGAVNPDLGELFFWLFREAMWWWVMARLASLLGAFVLTSRAMADLRRQFASLR